MKPLGYVHVAFGSYGNGDTGIVGLVLLRSLRKDITLYNQLLSEEERELLEESGWKLVGHDVFRAPAQSSSFCVLIGTGMQLVAMASVVIFGAAAGYLNPARRGSIAMGLLFIFILFGMLAGYTSGRMFKVFGTEVNYQNDHRLVALLAHGR